MLKILWKNNYWIDKKSTLWVTVDDFYTKQHQENLGYFDEVEKLKKTIWRSWTLTISSGNASFDSLADKLSFILHKWALWIPRNMFYDSIEYNDETSYLNSVLDQWWYDLQNMLNKLFLEWENTAIEYDILTSKGLEEFIKLLSLLEQNNIFRKNGFQYNPHIKKYVNTIYAGNLFESLWILPDKIGRIDDGIIDEIIKILPKNRGKIEKQFEVMHNYPVDFTSLLKVTLKDGEIMQQVQCENTLFFSATNYTKDLYIFFRELYIIYIKQYREHFNKKNISLLDFSASKSKNNIMGSSIYSVHTLLSEKNFIKRTQWDFEKRFWSIVENKKYVKTPDFLQILLEKIELSRKKASFHKDDFISYCLTWDRGTGFCSSYLWWWDEMSIYNKWITTWNIIQKDRERLREKKYIDWYKYDLDFKSAKKDDTFISKMISHIKNSKHNLYCSKSNTIKFHSNDFQKACIQAIWVDVLEILKDNKIEVFEEELRIFFKQSWEWKVIQFLIKDALEKKSIEEIGELFIAMWTKAVEDSSYIKNFEYLWESEKIKKVLYELRGDERLAKIYMKLSRLDRSSISEYLFLDEMKSNIIEEQIQNDIKKLENWEDIDWFRYDLDLLGQWWNTLGVSKEIFVKPMNTYIEKWRENVFYAKEYISVSENFSFQSLCIQKAWVDVLSILKESKIHYLEWEIKRFFHWMAPKLIEYLIEEAFEKLSEEERIRFVFDVFDWDFEESSSVKKFDYLKRIKWMREVAWSLLSDNRFASMSEDKSNLITLLMCAALRERIGH